MIRKESLVNLEIKGKPNPENQDLMDSNERYSFADGEITNRMSDDSEYNYEMDSNIESDGDIMIDNSGIIYACSESTDNLIKFSKDNKNILISSNKKINDNWNSLNEDLRYSSIISGASNIVLESFYNTAEDYKLFLKNAERISSPLTEITILDKRRIINSLANYCSFKKINFKTSSLEKDVCKIVIKKNNLSKLAHVSVGDNHSFICDIAETMQDKTIGLQDRDRLQDGTGMLFVYKKASDLYFHMGNVKFPIDIVFIDENNRIAKIFDDIQPKTLGTFGCKNAKTVLEIDGGFCKKSNISVGDYIEYRKLSSLNKKELRSALSPSVKSFSKTAKLSRYDFSSARTVLAVDEKSILPEDKTSFFIGDSKVSWNSLKHFDSKDLSSRNIKIASFEHPSFGSDTFEHPFVDKIVVYGNLDDSNINRIAVSKFFETISLENINFEIINTAGLSQSEVSKAIENRFSSDKVFFTSGPIYKSASFPVSESVKELARKADERILVALKSLKSIVNDLDQNVSAYNAYKDNQEVISASKAQYHQSVKKIIEKYESMLETIKAGMTILYKIKDASQVEDNIKGMAQSAAMVSESLNKIFELVNKIDDLEFFNNLSDLTNEVKNLSKDVEFSMKGCREFIHSHILGILILS